jgi:hypothetical protein
MKKLAARGGLSDELCSERKLAWRRLKTNLATRYVVVFLAVSCWWGGR